jgi:hypothetical protein
MERITTSKEIRTEPKLYHLFSCEFGLPVSTLLECQKRGLLPRDLATCTPAHLTTAGTLALALGSEEILRAAISRLPKKRRMPLIHPIVADGFLTRWQRKVLDHFLVQYNYERYCNPSRPDEKGKSFGSSVTSVADMILLLEENYALPAETTRPWILKLKKIAYNRVRRGKGPGKGGHDDT